MSCKPIGSITGECMCIPTNANLITNKFLIDHGKISVYADPLQYIYPDKSDAKRRNFSAFVPLYGGVLQHGIATNKNYADLENEEESETKYLHSKPPCIMIVGKEIPDTVKLAQKISENWGCVCINPFEIVEKHIGDAEGWILRRGEAVPSSVVLKMILAKLFCNETMHRGYVLVGLPFSSPILTKWEKISVDSQLKMVFESPFRPDILIYIATPNNEVLMKRRNVRFNPHSGKYVWTEFLDYEKKVHVVSGARRGFTFNENTYTEIRKELYDFDRNHTKYLVTLPFDFENNINNELQTYKDCLSMAIEKCIAKFHPQNIIRLDGRSTFIEMLQVVMSRLDILNLQRTYIPKPILTKRKNEGNEVEEGEDDLDEEIEEEEVVEEEEEEVFDDPSEMFEKLKSIANISSDYRWKKSHWGTYCPVALKEGYCITGKMKYCVSFLDKLYFLSTKDRMNIFIENPRPYLCPPNPEIPCRFIVIGPKFSGKTTVVKFLSAVFRGQIIDYKDIVDKLLELKINAKIEEVKSIAVEEAYELFYVEEEKERLENIERWKIKRVNEISCELEVYKMVSKMLTQIELSEEQSSHSENEEDDNDMEIITSFGTYTVKECEEFIENPELLKFHLDKDLERYTINKDELEKEKLEVQNYVAEAVSALDTSEITLDNEEIGAELIQTISEIQNSQVKANASYHGWIIDDLKLDPGLWEVLYNANCSPHEIICLTEEDENFEYLTKLFETRDDKTLQNSDTELFQKCATETKSRDVLSRITIGSQDDNQDFHTVTNLLPPLKMRVKGLSPFKVLSKVLKYRNPMFKVSESEESLPVNGATSSEYMKTIVTDIALKSVKEYKIPEPISESVEEEESSEPEDINSKKQNDYLNGLLEWRNDWVNLYNSFSFNSPPLIYDVSGKQLTSLLTQLAKDIERSLRMKATVSSEDFEEEEEEDMDDDDDPKTKANEEDGEGDVLEEGEQEPINVHASNRVNFCPVAFHDSNVLWPGSKEFSVKYANQKYFTSSEAAQDAFIKNVWLYTPVKLSLTKFPPLRICVVGPLSSGKSTISKILADILGIIYADFLEDIDNKITPAEQRKIGRKHEDFVEGYETGKIPDNWEENEKVTALHNYIIEGTPLPDHIIDLIVPHWWKNNPGYTLGFIYAGFPYRSPDVEYMTSKLLIPDIIVELKISEDEVQKRALSYYFEIWQERQYELKNKVKRQDDIIMENWEIARENRKMELRQELLQSKRALKKAAISMEDDLEDESLEPAASEPQKPLSSPSLKPEASEFRKPLASQGVIGVSPSNKMNATSETKELKFKSVTSTISDSDFEARKHISENNTNISDNNLKVLEEENEVIENLELDTDDDVELDSDEEENIKHLLDEEFPKPEIRHTWESKKKAKRRLEEQISEWFNLDSENIETMKEMAEEKNILWKEVEVETSLEDVILKILWTLSTLCNRGLADFEVTSKVSLKKAEQLINSGYFFSSKFGKWCPVQIYTKSEPIQKYLPKKDTRLICPVIHRQYIYFLANDVHCKEFIKDPIKYINQEPPVCNLPMKVAIIGPPKSGKSTLSEHLAKQFGFKVITCGQSLRNILEEMPNSALSTAVEAELRKGYSVPKNLSSIALESSTISAECVSQGFILDGFPNTMEDLQYLLRIGLIPYAVFVLKGNFDLCNHNLHSAESSKDKLYNNGPIYASNFLQYKYDEWHKAVEPTLKWLEYEHCNLKFLDVSESSWIVYHQACKHLFRLIYNYINYFQNVKKDVGLPLEYLCVSPLEFALRQNPDFRNYCPVCIKVDSSLTAGDIPTERSGLVEYKEYYYWVCKDHIKLFIENPKFYSTVKDQNKIPTEVPHAVVLNSNDENVYRKNIYLDGYCIVSYCEHLPQKVLELGCEDYAVQYKDNIFLFANETCMKKFMRQPEKYSKVKVDIIKFNTQELEIQKLQVKYLPNLGFLQQTVADLICKCLTLVAANRPKYVGFDEKTSVALFLGYYLKVNNPNSSPETTYMFEKRWKTFKDRCNVLIWAQDIMQFPGPSAFRNKN